MLRRGWKRKSGYVLVNTMVMLVALLAIGSLGVDFAHVQLVRTELQSAADSAARAGAMYLGSSPADSTGARSAAIAAAGMNSADGQPVVLGAADISVGNYDETLSPKFSTSRSPLNAVSVATRRDRASGNSVPLACARALGIDACDVSASATARCDTSPSRYGIVGVQRASFGSLGVLAQINGRIVSNGDINVGCPLGLSVKVNGDAMSYRGNVNTGFLARVSGSTAALTDSLNFPSVTVPTTYDNTAIACYVSANGDLSTLLGMTVPSGTYVVRDLNLLAGLAINLQGPVTIYVTRSVNIAAGVNLLGSGSTDPANLKIRVAQGGCVNFLANLITPVYMDVYAPDIDINIGVGVNHYHGRLIGKTLDIALPVLGQFTEDTTLAPPIDQGVSLVK